ncbi:MAG: DUF4418 family protein [Planctomycetes bacterium]|nr:DUF4418 family protein [Planctomycetota bacterium]MBW8040895.1 DUF4418 family protein [Planctomycetota bacterium]
MKISLSRALATVIVVLGLSVAFIPKYVFPICESGNLGFFNSYQPTMRCFWFGRMELLLGGLVVLCSLIIFFRPTPDTHFAIGALLIGLGLVILLVSLNTVIGSTCGHRNSICQIGTKPAERIAGALVTISGLILVVFRSKRCEQK